MSYTSAQESDINVMMKLGAFGFFYGILQCLEIQMSFVTMPPLLMTSAASILFFCTNLQKALAGSINAAILTVTSQGSWDTFRGAITEDNAALIPFKNSILGHPNGPDGSNWSAGSLELINRAIAKQAEVLSFIDVSHWIGVVLLVSCFLPLLHREDKENKDSG
jgi:DHA2 family multidrug resistance protein